MASWIGLAEVSVPGAACLAGLELGIFKDLNQIKALQKGTSRIEPGENREKVKTGYQGWQREIRGI